MYLNHFLKARHVGCTDSFLRQCVPYSDAPDREKTFSGVGVCVSGKNPKAVAPSPLVWKAVKHVIWIQARFTVKQLPTLYQISANEPPLDRIQVQGL